MNSSDNLTNALKQAMWNILAGVHTALPAEVSKYDSSGPRVEVKPMIKRVYKNNTILDLPVIVSVPVLFFRTARFKFTFPLEKGDGVLLVFAERSLETWLSRGEAVAPQDPRKFDLSDAIAIPGLWAFDKGLSVGDGSQLELEFDDVKISADGKDFIITNGQATIESNGGTVAINSDGLTVD